METTRYWRNIYKTINGNCKFASPKHVSDVLENVKSDLQSGLQLYKSYSNESFEEWKKHMNIAENRNFISFMKKLCKSLNIDCTLAYSLFCNYLMFDYYGKLDAVQEITKIDIYKEAFCEKIWLFYTLERMFLLKTLRCIFENYDNPKHRYREIYKQFLNKITIKSFKTSLLAQYKNLLYEIDFKNRNNCIRIKDWVDRNNAEQIEILIILIHCIHDEKLGTDEFIDLIKLFNEHGFGFKPPHYHEATSIANMKDLRNVIHMEYAVFLIAIQHNWGENGFETPEKFGKLFDVIFSLTEDHSILMLSLCILIVKSNDSIRKQYEKYIIPISQKCFNDKVFTILLSVVGKEFFKECKLDLIVKYSVFQLMTHLCNLVEDVFNIYMKTGSIELLACLMEVPEISVKVINPEEPIHKLFSMALNLFPYNYKTFSLLCLGLLKNKIYIPEVMNFLCNIQSYCEETSPMDLTTVEIYEDHQPIKGVIIPKHSKANVINTSTGQSLLFFSGEIHYTYFHYLKDYFVKLFDNYEDPNQQEYTENVIIGLMLLVEAISLNESLQDDENIQHILHNCIFILTRTGLTKFENNMLINSAFQFLTAFMATTKRNLMQNLLSSHSLPTIPKNFFTVEKLLQINIINESDLLQCIMKERTIGNYQLLQSYIKFSNDALMYGYDHDRLTVPSMVFLLSNIFPQHLNWQFNVPPEKNEISHQLLLYLFTILQMQEKIKNPTLKSMYEFCKELVFNYEPFIKTFMACLRIKNAYLEHIMTQEIDWTSGQLNNIIKMVRTCISITLWMFNVMDYNELKKTNFYRYFFYTGANFPSIIKILCEYVNHKLDPILPKLACRLLKRISMDSAIPILASLEMESYQVQWMFLERLRDPLEDDEMKVVLLEMIAMCVKHQNGMTAAFFNLTLPNKNSEKREETLISYMHEYLKNINVSPEYLKSPVQASLLELFHVIWAEKKKLLVKELTDKEVFWKTIIDPLMKDLNLSNSTYTQVLDILASEVFNPEIDSNLKSQLKNIIFSENSEICQKISEHISLSIEENDKDDVAVNLLFTWKKFLVFMIKNYDDLIHKKTKSNITECTLTRLINYIKDPTDIRVVVNWADLYLYLITKWKKDAYDGQRILKLLVEMYSHLERIFPQLKKKCKETFICILIKTFDHFDDILDESPLVIIDLLSVFAKIVEKEYETVLLNKTKPTVIYIDYVVWMLIVIFANRLVKHTIHAKWFFFTQFMDKVLNTIGFFMSSPDTIPIAKISSQFLINYLDSSLFQEFSSVNYQLFYDSIKPPAFLLNYHVDMTENHNLFYYEEFWLAYGSLIHFNLKLLCRFEHLMFSPLLEFLAMHRLEIFNIIRLPQVTVDIRALKLVSNTLRLINYLLCWKKIWRALDEPLYTAYHKMVSECFNSCVNIVLRPQIVKTYKTDENFKISVIDKVPVEFFAGIMDRVIEIIGSSALALLHISPNLVDLLGQCTLDFPYFGQFDYSFHIPNTDNPTIVLHQITFGGVLCILHYLCKTMLQILTSKKVTTKEADLSESASYLTFINPDYLEKSEFSDKFSSIQRFATSEIYSLSAPWLAHMDKERVLYTLEVLNTLLASQIFKAIMESKPINLQLLKRDLCSELQFYHEFVRKKLMDQHKYIILGNTVLKSKNYVGKNSDDSISENAEYLLMLSHWFMVICQLTP